MAVIEYYCDGRLHRLNAQPASSMAAASTARRPGRAGSAAASGAAGAMLAAGVGAIVTDAIQAQVSRLGPLFHSVSEASTLVAVPPRGDAAVVPTATLIVEGASKS